MQTKQNHTKMITKAETLISRAVTKSTNQNISGIPTFNEAITIENLTVNGDVTVTGYTNERNLSDIYQHAVFIDKDVILDNPVVFVKDVYFKSIVVKQNINNISISQIIATNTSRHINGAKTFHNITFADGVSRDIQVGGTVNGIDTQNLVLLDTNQTITASHVFSGNVKFGKNLKVDGLVNQMNVTEIADDTLINGKDSIVTAHKTFDGINVQGNLNMAENETINYVDVSNLTETGVYLNAANDFGNVFFNGNVTFLAPVTLDETLNGENTENLIFTDQAVTFHHPITFKKNITCSEDIYTEANINGLNISSKNSSHEPRPNPINFGI